MDVRPHLAAGATGGAHGEVDFRLARRKVIAEWRKGRLSRSDVCDAHPELLRVARNVGKPTRRTCPVCEDAALVDVQYAFGRRLPPGGRLIETPAELARLDRSATEVSCYTVEVCPACGWNHLTHLRALGGRSAG